MTGTSPRMAVLDEGHQGIETEGYIDHENCHQRWPRAAISKELPHSHVQWNTEQIGLVWWPEWLE